MVALQRDRRDWRASDQYRPHSVDLINNSAYLNSVNFNLLCRDANNSKDVPDYNHKLINNLGYKGRSRSLISTAPPVISLRIPSTSSCVYQTEISTA